MALEPEQLLTAGTTDRQSLAESLLDTYFGDIHRLALSILHDEDAADDVAQDTFITALRHIGRYEPGTNLRAWLSTITVNLCRDRLRRRQARQRWGVLWLGAQRQPGNHARDLEAGHVRREANSALWQSVNALDEKHRLPVILRYANGLSIREVADVLNIPEGTVHSRLHHACRKLAATLAVTDSEALVLELFNE